VAKDFDLDLRALFPEEQKQFREKIETGAFIGSNAQAAALQ
jgi:hypothetical protein